MHSREYDARDDDDPPNLFPADVVVLRHCHLERADVTEAEGEGEDDVAHEPVLAGLEVVVEPGENEEHRGLRHGAQDERIQEEDDGNREMHHLPHLVAGQQPRRHGPPWLVQLVLGGGLRRPLVGEVEDEEIRPIEDDDQRSPAQHVGGGVAAFWRPGAGNCDTGAYAEYGIRQHEGGKVVPGYQPKVPYRLAE